MTGLRKSRNIGVFGGSFDPPHLAHLMVASWALASEGLDELVVVPSYQHPLKAGARTSYDDRVVLCWSAFESLRDVTVSRIEEELNESRTLYTLEALKEREPDASFRLVIGADILAETHRWHRWDRITELAPPLVIGREGYASEAEVDLPGISSTEVRRRLASGESVRGLLSDRVIVEIADRGLYRGS